MASEKEQPFYDASGWLSGMTPGPSRILKTRRAYPGRKNQHMRTNYDKKPMHLFRGAPSVRGWSKYQQTVMEWTLCGRRRNNRRACVDKTAEATEDASLVSCPGIVNLSGPGIFVTEQSVASS